MILIYLKIKAIEDNSSLGGIIHVDMYYIFKQVLSLIKYICLTTF